jgi:formylglycine-generating enzyme required for sulfatase activity
LYEAKQYPEAEKQLGNFLMFSPQTPLALDYYGLTLLKLGRLEQAVGCFEKLIELQPDCADGLQHLGDAYSALGKVAMAKTFWEQAKTLAPCGNSLGQKKQAPKPKVGDTFQDKLKDGGLGPEMVVIPAGKFKMGDDDSSDGEGPAHQVMIAYEFAMGKYPVTFDEYDLFCQATQREKPSDSGWGPYSPTIFKSR